MKRGSLLLVLLSLPRKTNRSRKSSTLDQCSRCTGVAKTKMRLSFGVGNDKDGIGEEIGVIFGSSIDCTEKELVE